MLAAYVTVLIQFIRFWIENCLDGYDWGNNIGKFLGDWFHNLIIGVTIVVVAVPEGLPLAVMISLAYSVRKMLKDKNFVKRLASCEIMGGANNICSDKTGTLTMNKMHVTNVWNGDDQELPAPKVKKTNRQVEKKTKKEEENEGEESSDDDLPPFEIGMFFKDQHHGNLFIQNLACNTQGTHKDSNATDKAMIKVVPRTGNDYKAMREKHLPDGYVRFPFTSKRKKMSTVLENIDDNEFGYDKRLHVKGAAEQILKLCSHWLNEDGQKEELSDDKKKEINDHVIEKYAENALRTICCAYKDLRDGEGGATHENDASDGFNKEIELSGLTFICVLGIKDIIRPEVPQAVEDCFNAQVRVRMVTGDNKITAMAIAKECNLITEKKDYSVLEGQNFYDIVGGLYCANCKKDIADCECKPEKQDEKIKNTKEFKKIRTELCVLARSRPDDKYLLVTGLKQFGDVVAVTGDGTNDAPALKKADVGFAMGITGTDVAKDAADIILLDDNFASIVKACVWGRNIYDNIRRFLQFQLTVNVVALASAFVGGVLLKESPLAPIQLLWVNLIMDSLGSLALATEPPNRAK